MGMSYDDLVSEAAAVPPGSEGLVFLPYLTGERTPHLDPSATGAFIGLTARHTRAHLTRAVMEGVVFALRDGIEVMRTIDVIPTEIRAIGGGASSNLWLQLQADVFGTPIHRMVVEEGAAYGAALLGHVTAGTFRDVDEASAAVRTIAETTDPVGADVARYDEVYAVFHGLYGRLRDDMHRLAALDDVVD